MVTMGRASPHSPQGLTQARAYKKPKCLEFKVFMHSISIRSGISHNFIPSNPHLFCPWIWISVIQIGKINANNMDPVARINPRGFNLVRALTLCLVALTFFISYIKHNTAGITEGYTLCISIIPPLLRFIFSPTNKFAATGNFWSLWPKKMHF